MSGYIDAKRTQSHNEGFRIWTKNKKLKTNCISWSKDGKGVIEFADFMELVTTKSAERDPRYEILKAFQIVWRR